jgi:hypothetical protein
LGHWSGGHDLIITPESASVGQFSLSSSRFRTLSFET